MKTRAIARARLVASISSVTVGLGLGLALLAGAVAADTPSPDSTSAGASPSPIASVAAAVQQEAAAAASPSVNPRDLDCLTAAVYYEARGEAPAGQAAVAQVVLNRVRRFAPSVCGVVYQGARGRGCQFSFACHGARRDRREAAAWSRARSVAARALSGYVMADVGHATYFHVASLGQVWGPHMGAVARVGHHIFYCPNGRHQLARAYRVLETQSKVAAASPETLRGPEPTAASPTVQDAASAAPPAPETKTQTAS